MVFQGFERDDTMYYVLYDLREKPSLAGIHLPTADEDGPVLLLIKDTDCVNLYAELNEMNENEGLNWLTTLLQRPEFAPGNATDLLVNEPYILIAHIKLMKRDPEGFLTRLTKMKRWMPN